MEPLEKKLIAEAVAEMQQDAVDAFKEKVQLHLRNIASAQVHVAKAQAELKKHKDALKALTFEPLEIEL